MSGWWADAAWAAAFVFFGVLALVSGFLAAAGQTGCRCLGAVKVHPWITFAIDMAAMAAVALVPLGNATRIGAASSQGVRNGFWRSWIAWSASIFLTLLLGLSGWWYFHNESFVYMLQYLKGERLIVYPYRVSVGSAPIGETGEVHFTIWNSTSNPVKLVGNRSTCNCMLTTDQLPLTIPAGQRREFTVIVGFGREAGGFEHGLFFYTDCPQKSQVGLLISGQASARQARQADPQESRPIAVSGQKK